MGSDTFTIIVDDVEVEAGPDQTVMEACDAAGIYIPRLCYHPELVPGGHCRVCTCKVNGKPMNTCTLPAQNSMVIENNTPELTEMRRHLIEMLFVEGNHVCPMCEASGRCELQALAYRFGMTTPEYPYKWASIEVDASHPDVYIDRNRCVLCGRCVRSSRDLDKKQVFGFEGRGDKMKVAINADHGLSETGLSSADKAVALCPTGSIVIKRQGYRVPYGKRPYDKMPIGSDIEKKRTHK